MGFFPDQGQTFMLVKLGRESAEPLEEGLWKAITPKQLEEIHISCSAPSLPTEFFLVVVCRCM